MDPAAFTGHVEEVEHILAHVGTWKCGFEIADQHLDAGFAVDAYVNFARTRPWQEAVCSSLTELFAPEIHKNRLTGWPQHYPWIEAEGLQYFRSRVTQARRDVEHGLSLTLEHFRSREQQERALEILQFKLDVLWSMLDAMQTAFGLPGERRVA